MAEDFTSMLIELVEIQTIAENMKIDMSERAFQRGKDLRILLKRWDENGPRAPEWTKDLRDRNQAAQEVIASAIALQQKVNAVRKQRNEQLVALARSLDTSKDLDPRPLLYEMLIAYRQELATDLPPIRELFSDFDHQISEIEALVEARMPTREADPNPRIFGRKRN
jgi:hypothetical protein